MLRSFGQPQGKPAFLQSNWSRSWAKCLQTMLCVAVAMIVLEASPALASPPEIVDFSAIEGPGGVFWTFEGYVIDEEPGGLEVLFGGVGGGMTDLPPGLSCRRAYRSGVGESATLKGVSPFISEV